MIQIDDLSLFYHGIPVFEDVSFTINAGERCGFVGRNGSGKTSLMRLLVGQEKQDSGVISFPRGYKLGYLDQHIRFTSPTVLDEAVLGLKEEEKEEVYKAEKILLGLGFKEEDLDKDPHLFSGGYQLRLHLAKVLLSEPNCLLLDEPTNYLDILSIRFLERFLCQFKGEMILISHDREFMDNVTTHTLGLHRKKIKKCTGGTKQLFEQISQDEEIYEKTRQNQDKKRAHLQSFIDRFGAKATKAGQAQSKQKLLNRIPALEKLKALYDLEFYFQESPFYGKKMLEMDEVSFSYSPDIPLIQSVSLVLEKGQRVAIIGKNGFGKSTLLRLMAGELTPVSGEITVSDRVEIGYFGQTHIQRLHPQASIEDEIAAANTALNITQVKAVCGQMLFGGDLSKKKISVLSGGEKSRVLLGKILSKQCNLLLLDEPTHHLDIESIESLMDAIEEFEGSVIMVTHSELILNRFNADQLIVCHANRQTLFQGTYAEFLEKVGWEEEEMESRSKKQNTAEIERKKKHEELMALRALAKPLEIDFRRMKKKIEEIEKKQKEQQEKLAHISQDGAVDKIQEASKALERLDKELAECYASYFQIEEELASINKREV